MSEAEWEAWNKRLERDLAEGRFDKLIAKVKEQHKQGLTMSYEEGRRIYEQKANGKRTQSK